MLTDSSIIMILIIGIIGSLITVYALGYMKDFQHHHADQKDRRPWFFFVMFLFLGAMVGLVTSNNIIWMYFFWEITSLSSFWLIGFTKTGEAMNNSFRALIMNLLGGLGFAVGIVILGERFRSSPSSALCWQWEAFTEISLLYRLYSSHSRESRRQHRCRSTAGSSERWLLRPAYMLALLHSSTMVKAGGFMIIKLAPVLGMSNFAGIMTMMVGRHNFPAGNICSQYSQEQCQESPCLFYYSKSGTYRNMRRYRYS